MQKKQMGYVLPAIILPYFILTLMVAVFCLSSNEWFYQHVFDAFPNFIFFLLAVVLLFMLAAVSLVIVTFIKNLRRNTDALSLAKVAMIVKLAQIPSYLIIFVLCFFLIISIFTIPFAIGLFFLDCLCLFLSGLLTLCACINGLRQGSIRKKEAVVFILLQFVFVADVVVAILLFKKLSKKNIPSS